MRIREPTLALYLSKKLTSSLVLGGLQALLKASITDRFRPTKVPYANRSSAPPLC